MQQTVKVTHIWLKSLFLAMWWFLSNLILLLLNDLTMNETLASRVPIQ